jgi:hypothetical protein
MELENVSLSLRAMNIEFENVRKLESNSNRNAADFVAALDDAVASERRHETEVRLSSEKNSRLADVELEKSKALLDAAGCPEEYFSTFQLECTQEPSQMAVVGGLVFAISTFIFAFMTKDSQYGAHALEEECWYCKKNDAALEAAKAEAAAAVTAADGKCNLASQLQQTEVARLQADVRETMASLKAVANENDSLQAQNEEMERFKSRVVELEDNLQKVTTEVETLTVGKAKASEALRASNERAKAANSKAEEVHITLMSLQADRSSEKPKTLQ